LCRAATDNDREHRLKECENENRKKLIKQIRESNEEPDRKWQ
jgi:hypothetical protein